MIFKCIYANIKHLDLNIIFIYIEIFFLEIFREYQGTNQNYIAR